MKTIVGRSPNPKPVSAISHHACFVVGTRVKILTSEEYVSQSRHLLSKPPLEGTCHKIRLPPLFTDMQDSADTLNDIHRKHTGKQDAEIGHHASDGEEDLPP
ncbi:hypothetical protein HID58_040035 [Brassica napus]|uniref:Uncharacterized protein n=1 Tax=Brassica napus TaxID=3708 RepID=A0ABQ8B7R4_BRANA|nr:hypothetical protein HID58_040035 [Brassica napus]